MYTFFRELRWPFLPPIPAHNTMTSLSPATTLRVYKIHTTAFIKKKKKNEHDLLVPVQVTLVIS